MTSFPPVLLLTRPHSPRTVRGRRRRQPHDSLSLSEEDRTSLTQLAGPNETQRWCSSRITEYRHHIQDFRRLYGDAGRDAISTTKSHIRALRSIYSVFRHTDARAVRRLPRQRPLRRRPRRGRRRRRRGGRAARSCGRLFVLGIQTFLSTED